MAACPQHPPYPHLWVFHTSQASCDICPAGDQADRAPQNITELFCIPHRILFMTVWYFFFLCSVSMHGSGSPSPSVCPSVAGREHLPSPQIPPESQGGAQLSSSLAEVEVRWLWGGWDVKFQLLATAGAAPLSLSRSQLCLPIPSTTPGVYNRAVPPFGLIRNPPHHFPHSPKN